MSTAGILATTKNTSLLKKPLPSPLPLGKCGESCGYSPEWNGYKDCQANCPGQGQIASCTNNVCQCAPLECATCCSSISAPNIGCPEDWDPTIWCFPDNCAGTCAKY